MSAVITRIALRYAAATLITKGLLSPEVGNVISADPDVFQAMQFFLGAFFGALSEGWYYLAVKMGWSK